MDRGLNCSQPFWKPLCSRVNSPTMRRLKETANLALISLKKTVYLNRCSFGGPVLYILYSTNAKDAVYTVQLWSACRMLFSPSAQLHWLSLTCILGFSCWKKPSVLWVPLSKKIAKYTWSSRITFPHCKLPSSTHWCRNNALTYFESSFNFFSELMAFTEACSQPHPNCLPKTPQPLQCITTSFSSTHCSCSCCLFTHLLQITPAVAECQYQG